MHTFVIYFVNTAYSYKYISCIKISLLKNLLLKETVFFWFIEQSDSKLQSQISQLIVSKNMKNKQLFSIWKEVCRYSHSVSVSEFIIYYLSLTWKYQVFA